MLYNVCIILVSNALIPLLVTFFDVSVILRLIKRMKIISQGSECSSTQYEANQYFYSEPKHYLKT